MSFSWHKEHFDRTLQGISKYALGYINQGYDPGGWYDHFKQVHPEPFARYQIIYKELNDLWGKADSESMEKFKSLCKAFESAYKWALNKYIEFSKQEALKGTQTTLL